MALNLDYRQCGYPETELSQAVASLAEYCRELKAVASYESPESFLLLSKDENILNEVATLGNNTDGALLIGIGASSLGALAIAQALHSTKKLLVADAVDERLLKHAQEILEAEYVQGKKYQTIIVSKSGTTLETLVNTGALVPFLKNLDPEFANRTLVITDKGTPLWEYAAQQGWKTIASPISGRYSMFSPVALAPLAFLGIDIGRFRAGAQSMQEICLDPDVNKNPALWGAAATYLNYQHGKSTHALFFLNPLLRGLSRWWQQLISESLGKDGKGILPILSEASDMHALSQFYMDGPANVFTTFIELSSDAGTVLTGVPLLSSLNGKKIEEVTRGINDGIRRAYIKKKLPHITINFDDIDEESLGAFCALKMLETVYLAKLMGVNAFDQPGVELYKQEVKSILRL